MSEQRVPYQAGEPAEQRSLPEVAAEAWFRVCRLGWMADDWEQNFTWRQKAEWAAMTAAVEAEVLRRMATRLRREWAEMPHEQDRREMDIGAGWEAAARSLEEYAQRQEQP